MLWLPCHQSLFLPRSERYYDDVYEYRHVVLPQDIAKRLPKDKLLSEPEWRALGVQQSRGWGEGAGWRGGGEGGGGAVDACAAAAGRLTGKRAGWRVDRCFCPSPLSSLTCTTPSIVPK